MARPQKAIKAIAPLYIKDLTEFDFPESELALWIPCPVGTNFGPILEEFKRLLKRYRYAVNEIHLSDYVAKLGFRLEDKPEYRRIETRMDAARDACKAAARKDLMAIAAVTEIAKGRSFEEPETHASPRPMVRVAHLLTSLS